MVSLAFLLIVCIMKEPCDGGTSRVQINPFHHKEPIVALYQESESRLVSVVSKSGAQRKERVADFRCGFCGSVVQKNVCNAKKCYSCGCAKGQLITQKNSGIRQKFLRENRIWQNMKNRCLREKNHNFSYYGGRGVKICDRWLDSFENFISDMGACPEGFSLDRINSDGNYEPSNCRWASWAVQCKNRRVANVIEVDGHSMNLSEWLELDSTVSKTQFYRNLKSGLSPSESLFRRGLSG